MLPAIQNFKLPRCRIRNDNLVTLIHAHIVPVYALCLHPHPCLTHSSLANHPPYTFLSEQMSRPNTSQRRITVVSRFPWEVGR
jgi:hypothetical protein